MKIPVIKQITELYTIDQLKIAEENLLNGNALGISVEGSDEGEQLTHILAAIFIKEYMLQHGNDYPSALRAYSQKVRASIS
jgi:hypothetical protein